MGAESGLGSFDWCGFCSLWYNDKGLRCKINLVDTVLFRHGKLSAWWATNKEGYIQRHTTQTTTLEAIRRRFLAVANDDESNYSTYVCILRRGDGRPQLVRTQAFNQLCKQLSDALEAGHTGAIAADEVPDVMQAFVQPFMDLRYVSTFVNQGRDSCVHTFQRKYSRRYTPLAAEALSVGADPGDIDILNAAAQGVSAVERTAEAVEQRPEGPVDAVLKVRFRKLMVHLVKYIEKAHGLTLAGLVCEFIRDAGGKVYLLSVTRAEWASNANGRGAGSLASTNLTVDAIDLEESSNEDMAPYDDGELTRPPFFTPQQHVVSNDGVRRPFSAAPSAASHSHAAGAISTSANARPYSAASSAGHHHGNGGGGGRPLSATSYSALSVRNDDNISVASASRSATGSPPPAGAGGGLRPKSAASVRSPGTSPGTMRPVSPTPHLTEPRRSSMVQYPGTTPASRALVTGLALTNSWPSQNFDNLLTNGGGGGGGTSRPMSAVGPNSEASRPTQVGQRDGDGNGGATASQKYSALEGGRATAALAAAAAEAADAGGNPHQRIFPWGEPRPASAKAGGQAGQVAFLKAVPPVPVHKPMYAERPASGSDRTGHTNSGPRGAPLIMSHMQQEVETLRDQLLYQHTIAEAATAKVRQLEVEKETTVEAFNRRVGDLQGQLNEAREELMTVQIDRNTRAEALVTAEARVAELEARSSGLGSTLDTERATVLAAMREFQEKDAALKRDRELLEAEVLNMAQRLKEEQMTVAALKRQLTQYAEVAERYNRNRGQNGGLEEGMEDVLARIQPLFTGQANPEGEQYALQKVLYHHHPDLRAVFMYYAQLSKEFAKHWPPRMTHVQWMLFCRDSETSDPRSGARIRSSANHRMISPAICEDLFREYAQTDDDATDPKVMVLSYESFLAGIVHLGFRVKRPEVAFISEAIREYIIRYLSKAGRVRPAGIQQGMVRMALEGIRKVKKTPTGAGAGGHSDGERPHTAPLTRPQTAPPSSAHHHHHPHHLVKGGGAGGGAAGAGGEPTSRPLSFTSRVGGSVPTAEPRNRATTPRTRWGAKPVTAVVGDDKSPEAIMAELQALGIPLNV